MQAINVVNEMLKPLFDAVDENFKQFQPVNKLAGLLKVRPAHIILAFFILAIIALGTGLFSSVFVAIFGFIYPAYMTFKALKAQDSEQCKEWLTYWIVFGFFTAFSGVLKKTFFFFLSRRTFNVFRILFYVFLFHPSCRGASLIYNKILRSKLRQVTAEIEQEQIHQKQA